MTPNLRSNENCGIKGANVYQTQTRCTTVLYARVGEVREGSTGREQILM